MSASAIVGQSFASHDFEVTVLKSGSTETEKISSLASGFENVVLDFYTTWCQKCPEVAKDLDLLAAKNPTAKYILVNLENDVDGAREFFSNHNLQNCVSTTVDDELLSNFNISGIPHKTLISNGVIKANGPDVKSCEGGELDFSTMTTPAVDTSNSSTSSSSTADPTRSAAFSIHNRDAEAIEVSRMWKSYEKDEVLLKENSQRWVMFPIKHPAIWEMYKKHEASFWTAEEIDLAGDMVDWEQKLSDDERHFLKHVLAFFAGSDGIVLENLAGRFGSEVQLPEARAFYGFQMAMENIHSETYSLLIDQYLRNDEAEKARLFNAISTIPVVQKKAMWAASWMSEDLCFAERLVAFAAVEGILFSGSFCAIYYMKKRGLMPGLTFSNELIARDEGLHADFACLLYKMLDKPLPLAHVEKIVRGAVLVEREFICDALSCSLVGMNAKLMSQYIEFVADRLLGALGHEKIYNVSNPFEWMEMISLQGKTNFFEKRVGDYQKSGVMKAAETESAPAAVGFSMDEDF